MPSGSRAARKGRLLITPSTIVMPREGSFALAFLGRVRRVHDPIFSVALATRLRSSCSPREGTRPTRFPRKSPCLVGPVPPPGGFFNGLLGGNNLALKRIVDLVSCGLAGFIQDFPNAFLPTNSVGLFCDFLPAPQVCKPFKTGSYPIRPRVRRAQRGHRI